MSINSNDTIYTIGGFHKTTTASLTSPNIIKTKHIDIYNVRISPQKITFMGAFDGKKFIEQVTVQNLGNRNVVIRFGTPTSFAFHIKGDKGKTVLAPGLGVTKSISYTCKITQSMLKTQFPIHIDNYVYNYLIEVFLATPCIIPHPPTIDFGIMNLGQSPIVREMIIQNVGDKTTTFKIDYSSADVNMVVSPCHGEIFAKSSLKMNLSLIHAPIGYHIREIWIKCDPKPIRVTIEIVVIHKQLSIKHENSTTDLTLVNFPMTFRGCERFDTFLLKNSSATSTCFVILLEQNQSLYNLENADQKYKDLEHFKIMPTSGMLCPFEERIIVLSYIPQKKSPKHGWKTNIPTEIEHSIYLTLMNVQDNLEKDIQSGGNFLLKAEGQFFGGQKSGSHLFSMKSIKSSLTMLPSHHSDGTSMKTMENEATFDIHSYEEPKRIKNLRLCLYGVSESINLIIEPCEISLNVLKTLEPIQRVLCLRNKSRFQEIQFVYIKHPYIYVNPTMGTLKPNSSIDIEVTIRPKTAGTFETAIEFEAKGMTIVYKTEKNYDWIPLNRFKCTLKYTLSTNIYKKERKPMFNTGLVPKNTVHSVGKNVGGITFTSNISKPKCAIYGVYKCPKHKNISEDQCLIAFPNDNLTVSTSPDQISRYRTIFAGIPRPSISNLYSKQCTYYDRFIRNNSQKLLRSCSNKSEKDRSIPCNCLDIKSTDLNLFEGIKINTTKRAEKTMVKLSAIDDLPRSFTYFPLTPIQLFNIQVAPHRIKFGKVSTDLATNAQLNIVNLNDFKIKLEMKSTHPEITFPIGSTILVNSQSQSGLLIRFYSKLMGKVHQIINYIINDSHSFDIDIFAEVTEKHLTFKNKIIEFNRNNIDTIFDKKSMPIAITNSVNSFTNFNFILSDDQQQYQVIPSKGTVPPLSTIICHLYRKLEYNLKSHTEISMVTECGRYESVIIKCDSIIPSISLVNTTIDVGILPLNILKTHHAFLYNPSQLDVTYLILNPNPIVGVNIQSISGILRPKSLTKLYIHLKIQAVISFDFIINIQIQNTYLINLRVRGKVIFPQVKIEPNKIKLRRISADSFDRMSFEVYNLGETEITINIPLDKTYSEFLVSENPNEIISPYGSQREIFLAPKMNRKLYIHFQPTDVASYEFFLPVIINQILGPVIFEREFETINPKYYLKNYKRYYLDNDSCNFENNIPDELSILRITVTVQSHILHLSKKTVNFYYSPFEKNKNFTHCDIVIKNVSTEIINFLLRIDSLQNTPFIVQAFGKHIEQTDVALIQNKYLPSDEVKLSIWFSPLQPGKYTAKLPIYVENYEINSRVYNYINLNGIYAESNLTTNVHKIYFGAVPLNITNERLIHIKAENYYVESVITTSSTSKYITVTCPKGNTVLNIDKNPIILPINIAFKSNVPISLCETVTITDRFGNECVIQVYACAENSIFTTYEFLEMYREFIKYETNIVDGLHQNNLNTAPNLILKKSSLELYSNVINSDKTEYDDICIDFPKYPEKTIEPTDISNYLNMVVSKVEMFLYERVFRYEYFATIPNGILAMVDVFCAEQPNNPSNKFKYFDIFTFLNRMYGEESSNFFSKGPLPTERIARVRFIYILFKQMIDFIEAQGGHVKHIDPKYLLSYEDYVIFTNVISPKIKESKENIYLSDRKLFDQYCKRSWLDMLLQSLKGKLLPHINTSSLANHAKIVDKSKPDVQGNHDSYKMSHIKWILSHDYMKHLNTLESNVYSLHERILLAWLNHHFDYHRQTIWRYGVCVPSRRICNFDTDLSDALPFVFVTMSYCPYVQKQCFNDLFTHATTIEMAYHNAACLINAWQDLNLGITVTPKDIVENNAISMLFLVLFLYFTLPDYIPCKLIHFKTNLSEISFRCVKIQTSIDTNYKVHFIGNENKCFYTNQDENIISVTDRGLVLRLFNHAKQIARSTSTLILIGEVSQGVFSSSLVLTLEGEPKLTPCQSISVIAPLYDNIEKIININVPYNCGGNFQIFINENEIRGGLETFSAYPWDKESLRKIPRKLFIKEKILNHIGGKTAKLHLYLSFLLNEISIYYLIFINKQIGDFIINITMIPQHLRKTFEFTYKIPETCCTRNCICKNHKRTEFEFCPCVINVPISKRNKYWWECFRKSQRQALPNEEWSFWDKRLGTNIGERLIQWLINESGQIAPQKIKIYKVNETYKIENLDTSHGQILHPTELYMEEMDIDGVVNLPIISHKPGKYILQLTSADGHEIRLISIKLTT